MSTLLTTAKLQLESSGPHAMRRACWLARAALEDLIDEMLVLKGIHPSGASERAKLSCLEATYGDRRELVFKAEYAWSRLSDACHQHAFELAPTHADAVHLVELVDELRDGLGAGTPIR